MKNIIIIGPGRTGSSILAGIISNNRFYINIESISSRGGAYPDGDYENPDLIRLNQSLFQRSGYGHTKVESNKDVDTVFMKNYSASKDISEFEDFIQKCNQNEPWLWKDPRLAFTIFFWKNLIDINRINFIFITRDPYSVFRSFSKYGIYYTKQEIYQRYQYQIDTSKRFFSSNNINPLHISYSELWEKEKLIDKLNSYLGTDISLKDYDRVVKTSIKKKEESEFSFLTRYYYGFLKLKASKLIANRKMKRS